MKNNHVTAVILALLACAIWSGNFVIARGAHEWMPPVTLAFWRWTVAFMVILPIGYKQVYKQRHLIISNWKYLLIMGTLGIGTFNTLIYIAAHSTTTHHIALISSTAPIFTLLLVGILGLEILSKYKIIGAICALCGAIAIITHGNILGIFTQKWNGGDTILIVTALIWAGWNVGLKYKPKELSSRSFLTVLMAFGVLFILPFYILEATYVAPTPFSRDAIYIYIYLGVFASVIAWFCWQYAVDNIGALKTSLIYYSIPVFSGIMAILILNEPVELYHITGFLLVFAGIFISNIRRC